MNDIASLTRAEAELRSALITVDRYDIAVDLSGLLDGDTLEATSTITFRCAQPGATTFLDCVAELRHGTLNGRELDLSSASRGRLELPDLAAENVLVIASAQSNTAGGAGVMRSVDASDKLVYVWMSFEPDDARRVWACFDQPDLKAPHAFTVTAPETWTVTSNTSPDSVDDGPPGTRLWRFADTPSLSTYVTVLNAGPYHEIRREIGGYSLGLYCRQSTARFLERDADELFDLTASGLAFFGEQFDLPFPQQRYDQVFVPDMGGAMENWGCVTWGDDFLFRSPGTYSDRSERAEVLLHEMAHMWFGDLVTMTWWDDLWLNEAFASWAAAWAAVAATEFTDLWASFLASDKLQGYRMDMGPASHPIRADVTSVSDAMANFDAITYCKGQAVLKQLVAHVGDGAFRQGLRTYFARHAWGNTRLDDLMTAVGEAAGTDLSEWTTAWLDRAGTDTITLADGELRVASPDEAPPRPHTLLVGAYRAAEHGLELDSRTLVATRGMSNPAALPAADLLLVNDEDLTFASVRPDAASLEAMLSRAAQLPTPMARALAVTTAWDLVVRGELATERFLDCLLGVLGVERSPGIVEPLLTMAEAAAESWTPPALVASQRAAVADIALGLAADPALRPQALRALAGSATTTAHFEALAPQVTANHELGWRVLGRRAELGDHDPEAVRLLLESDPDPEAATRALIVRAASPDLAAKEEAWRAVFHDRSVHAGGPLFRLGSAFWRPDQTELLRPFTHRYLDEVAELGDGGLLEQGGIVRSMFPVLADQEFLEAASAMADADTTPPYVRGPLLMGVDSLTRKLRARGR